MNLVAVQNQIKNLSDQQLAQELMHPTGAVPGFLVLSELQNRKQMRTAYPTQMPQGTMADEYGRGLMSGGAPNLYGAMGQSQAQGRPTPYGGGNVMAMPMGQQMGEAASLQTQMPRAFAGGGAVDGNEPWSYVPRWGYNPDRDAGGVPRIPYETPPKVPQPDVLSGLSRITQSAERPDYSDYIRRIWGGRGSFETALPQAYPGMTDAPASPGGQGYGGPEPVGLTGSNPSPQEMAAAPAPDNADALPAGDRPGGGLGGLSSPQQAAATGGPQGLADWIKTVRENMPASRYDELHANNKDARAELARQKETDKGLALLQAGLGILGGTSPNTMVNIGQGGASGVALYNKLGNERQVAERDLRRDESSLAIAQAGQEDRTYDRALTAWSRQVDVQQRHLDRMAAAGNASAALADRALDRKEMRELSELNGINNEIKTGQSAIHNLRRDYAQAIDPTRGGNENSPEALEIKRQITEHQANIDTSLEYLRQRRGERDTRKGRPTVAPKKVEPVYTYVPGQGVQWNNP